MKADLLLVLGVLSLVSLGLLYWAKIVLPRALEERFREALRAFGTAFELRYPIHRGQTELVRDLCRQVGHLLEFPQQVLRNLETAAQMRDVGLCAMPFRLGDGKPYDQWGPAERAAYMKHSELSAAMLEYIPSLKSLAPIVRQHHLPYRGATANGGTVRADVPFESRVLKVVADYVWFERWQGEILAIESLRAGADTEYDPLIVETLVNVLTGQGRSGEFAPVRSAGFEQAVTKVAS